MIIDNIYVLLFLFFVFFPVSVSAVVLEDYDYSYINDLESLTSQHDDAADTDPANDINGQADWELLGDWAINTADPANTVLDSNPTLIDQYAHNSGHEATMNGYVDIPTSAVRPVLQFRYLLHLIATGDAMFVEINEEGTTTWAELLRYNQQNNHIYLTAETIDLSAYKGKSVRVRFRQDNGWSAGARSWLIDDIQLGELQLADYDYPYFNDFESLISVHDAAADSDPLNDINGQVDWNTQGDWLVGTGHNGWTSYSGTYFLDSNPIEEDQNSHKTGQLATMNGYVDIPLSAIAPILSYRYKLALNAPQDQMYVEVEVAGSNTWTVLYTYGVENNYAEYTREMIDLSDYVGESIRLRFRQFNYVTSSSRVWMIDDFYIGDMVLEDYDYPYLNDFESLNSVHDDEVDSDPSNDINGRADWNLQGDWGMAGTNNSRTNFSGAFHLDNTPAEEDQSQHKIGQYASLNGFVDIPTNSVNPVLSYYYKVALNGDGDRMFVEVQVKGSTTWDLLTYYSREHDHAGYTREVLDLSLYKGQSVRIRFSQNNNIDASSRLWVIDDFFIGDLQLDDYDFPYANDFESLTSQHDDVIDADPANDINGQPDWNLQGDWEIVSQISDGVISFNLDGNPSVEDQYAHTLGQLATMNGYVDIPVDTVYPVMQYRYQLDLVGNEDRMYVEVNEKGSNEWFTLVTYKLENNQTSLAFETIDLSSYAGKSIRIRFTQYNTWLNGARSFLIDDFYIGELQLDDYDYPYFNDFESLISIHDGVADSDPSNDVNGQDDWNVQGDWSAGTNHSTWTSYSGNYHLDNNPAEEDQGVHIDRQFATMRGYVEIPVDSIVPVVSYRYKYDLQYSVDKVEVEIQAQGSNVWTLLNTHTVFSERMDYALETLDLSAYKGQSIRFRFKQYNGWMAGARMFVMDDFYIGEMLLDDFDYPYQNNFESLTSVHDDAGDSDPSNDVNGQADWNLQGDWGINNGHNGWTSYSGIFHLDNNPNEIDQYIHKKGQLASMMGYVAIPTDALLPVLSYRYKLALKAPGDRIYIELQSQGSPLWQSLANYSPQNNHADYTREYIDLSSYKGQSIRIRFWQYNHASHEPRIFVVDDFSIEELSLDDYDFPYVNDFESQTSQHDDVNDSNAGNDINGQADWNLQGDWGMSSTVVNGVTNSYLASNPVAEDQYAHVSGQLATMLGYVSIPMSSVAPLLSFNYTLDLIDATDSISVQIQEQGSISWTTLQVLKLSSEQANFTHLGVDLSAYKGKEIRIRFVQYHGWINGVRSWFVDDVMIYDSAGSISDMDGDGIPDNIDDDRDGDGVLNALDVFPDDPYESSDIDGDGIGDNTDSDRDGDGISNDYETQAGYDPNDPASTPPDLDGDSIPDQLDNDLDGDGIANDLEIYPSDPLRWQLDAVQNVTANTQQTSASLSWDNVLDVANLAGYNVYRQPENSGPATKLNNTLVNTISYVDETVSNATGYHYTVVAVDVLGNEGVSHAPLPFYAAYNTTAVTNLQAIRGAEPITLSWDDAVGMHYHLYRAEGQAAPTLLQDVSQHTLSDSQVVWSQSYRYQIATVADFINPFTSATFSIEGPLSDFVEVAAQPNITLQLNDVTLAAGDIYEFSVKGSDHASFTGSYNNAFGLVDVTAVSGQDSVASTSSDGTFRLIVPAVADAQWTITVTDHDYSDHQATTIVRIVKDTTPPTITIDGALTRNTQDEYIVISGTVTDDRSGVASIKILSDRYAGQSFGTIQGAGNSFYAEIPVEIGANNISVVATDGAAVSTQTQITVDRDVSLLPTVMISSPTSGTTLNTGTVSLHGVVYTSQAPENVRITFNGQQQFATGVAEAGYAFTFDNVSLIEGYNLLTVLVETPMGNAEASTTINYQQTVVSEPTPPSIQMDSGSLDATVSGDSFMLSGSISDSDGPITLDINGNTITLNGQADFQQLIDLSSYNTTDTITITIVATASNGTTSTQTFTIYRDNTAPVITITTPGIAPAPSVNRVVETPYILQGAIVDANLSGFTINGQVVTLTPGSDTSTYEFTTALALPLGQDQSVILEASDKAGNITNQQILFNADIPVAIEVISPAEDAEYQVTGTSYDIDVATRLTGLTSEHKVEVSADNGIPQLMTLDGNAATATISVPATDGPHTLKIQITNSVGDIVSQTATNLTFVNEDNLPLALLNYEPQNGQSGIEPDAFIALYFNRAIDPNLLQLNIRQTAHGLTYDLSGQRGTDPMLNGNTAKLVEVHYDQDSVTGGLSALPNGRSVAFYPTTDFAYNGDVYVDVIYDNQELERFTFNVRPLPTHIQGFLGDSLRQPLQGIEVQLPDLGRTTVTNNEGSYTFGFGDKAAKSLPGGRQRIVYNPGRKNPLYGEIERWINIEEGRLSQVDFTILPILNREVPYRRIQSGQNNILAQGELQLDLTNAYVSFPDGRSSGDAHVQFTPIQQLTFRTMSAATPNWVYAFQPGGIQLSANAQLKFNMPPLYGSYDYLPDEEALVLLVGFNNQQKLLEIIGVGKVQNRQVISVGTVQPTNLDYLGYVLKDSTAQVVIERYVLGEISFIQMKSELERLAQ